MCDLFFLLEEKIPSPIRNIWMKFFLKVETGFEGENVEKRGMFFGFGYWKR